MAAINQSPIDNKQVSSQLSDIHKGIKALQPHLNKAISAFGNVPGVGIQLKDLQKQLTDLENNVVQAKTVYQ